MGHQHHQEFRGRECPVCGERFHAAEDGEIIVMDVGTVCMRHEDQDHDEIRSMFMTRKLMEADADASVRMAADLAKRLPFPPKDDPCPSR